MTVPVSGSCACLSGSVITLSPASVSVFSLRFCLHSPTPASVIFSRRSDLVSGQKGGFQVFGVYLWRGRLGGLLVTVVRSGLFLLFEDRRKWTDSSPPLLRSLGDLEVAEVVGVAQPCELGSSDPRKPPGPGKSSWFPSVQHPIPFPPCP